MRVDRKGQGSANCTCPNAVRKKEERTTRGNILNILKMKVQPGNWVYKKRELDKMGLRPKGILMNVKKVYVQRILGKLLLCDGKRRRNMGQSSLNKLS